MPLTPLTNWDEELKSEGFQAGHARCFAQTAWEQGACILTRTPGGAGGNELMAQGYDCKGFHIKAKSCNWGPMSGLVLLDPLLNKNGAMGVADNAYNNYKSL